ncbi:hypothetical protein DPMN_118964 [Dreissena polymorpha]|uniref:C-type lectin domain-containing protein n=1 Tax=Dreissena polymorpha TaxID=45954 RepID=A0A9D4JP00_DREPO|nr:hypothetical protein DPMN_118964 [Dreissena polymorpha]
MRSISSVNLKSEMCLPPMDKEEHCSRMGAHVIVPDDADENTFIFHMKPPALATWGTWIGIEKEPMKTWLSYHNNKTVTYLPWYAGEPNGGTYELCATWGEHFTLQWDDVPCEWNRFAKESLPLSLLKKGDFLLEYKGDLITRVKHARDIAIGKELRYGYGVPTLPWRKKCTERKMGNTMTTRSTDSQEPGQTTSIHTEEVNETVCNISQDLRTARNQDKQHPYTRKKLMRRKGYFKYQENKTSSQKAMEVKTKKELFTDTLIVF